MKHYIYLLIFAFTLTSSLFAANMDWEKSLAANLGFSNSGQANWTAGAGNSFTWNFNVNGDFARNIGNNTWSNSLKFQYAQTSSEGAALRTSQDELRLESVYTFGMNRISPYVSATLLTQLTTGADYTQINEPNITFFFDPAYLTESAGFEFQPVTQFKARAGLALKQTIANKTTITDSSSEAGAELTAQYKHNLLRNLSVISKLNFFNAVEALENTDIYWDTTFNAKLSSNISAILGITYLYDEDLSTDRQLKHNLSIGINMSLI